MTDLKAEYQRMLEIHGPGPRQHYGGFKMGYMAALDKMPPGFVRYCVHCDMVGEAGGPCCGAENPHYVHPKVAESIRQLKDRIEELDHELKLTRELHDHE